MLALFLGMLESPEDRRLFALLYEREHEKMLRAALAMLHSTKDAEDAVQNAFLQAIRHFDSLLAVPPDKRAFWMIAVTQNEARILLRKKRRTVLLAEIEAPPRADGAGRAELADLIRRLPETYRCVLEMKFLLNCTDAQIAARLGISETAVTTRVSRARALLRKALEQEGASV